MEVPTVAPKPPPRQHNRAQGLSEVCPAWRGETRAL